MKRTIDKIDVNPPHAFSPQEFRSFLRLLPKVLLEKVSTVRLSSAIEHTATGSVAAFSSLEKRLVIISRGKKRRDVMFEVIKCLARANLHQLGEKKFNQLPPAEILRYANELLNEIESKMPPAPHWNRAKLKYVSQSKLKMSAQSLEPSAASDPSV